MKSCPRMRVRCVLLIATTLSRATTVQAQAESAQLAALRLRVVGDSAQPVVGAEIVLSGDHQDRRGRTDSAGAVRFETLNAGVLRATVRRVGFTPTQINVRVGAGENALTIRLQNSVATLDEVRVVANLPLAARLDDFEIRRLRGEASSVITRADIERRRPIALSQLLRGLPGIRLADSLGSVVAFSARGWKSAPGGRGTPPVFLTQCVLRVLIDGVVMPSNSNLDAVVPGEVYGVEIFNGPARVPVQFSGLRSDNFCGLIAIWTRDR